MVKVAARTRAAPQPAGAAAAPARVIPAQAAVRVAQRRAARRCLPRAVRGAAGWFVYRRFQLQPLRPSAAAFLLCACLLCGMITAAVFNPGIKI